MRNPFRVLLDKLATGKFRVEIWMVSFLRVVGMFPFRLVIDWWLWWFDMVVVFGTRWWSRGSVVVSLE